MVAAVTADTYGHDNAGAETIISGRIRKERASQSRQPYCGSQQKSVGSPESVGSATVRESKKTTTVRNGRAIGLQALGDDMVFDVPSSDNEATTSLDPQTGGNKKRRKLDIIEAPKDIWDDASLQQHIAMEMVREFPQVVTTADDQISVGNGRLSSKSHNGTLNTHRSNVCQRRVACETRSSPRISRVPSKGRTEPGITESPGHRGNPLSHSSSKGNAWIEHKDSTGGQSQLRPNGEVAASRLMDRPWTPLNVQPCKSPLAVAYGPGDHNPMCIDPVDVSSPSHLDILGLHILHSEARSLHGDTNYGLLQDYNEPKPATPSRVKLKDRLYGLTESPRAIKYSDKEDISNSSSDSGSSSASSVHLSVKHLPQRKIVPRIDGSSQESAYSTSSNIISRLQNGGPKITYARQRTFLSNDGLSDTDLLSMPLSNTSEPQVATGRAGARTYPPALHTMQGLSEEMDEVPNMPSGAIRSIHELREAGGNARVIGGTEATLDDIDPRNIVPLALKRSGLLDISSKLQQPDFCRRFVDHSLESRLLSHVDSSNDIVSNILLMTALLEIVANSPSPHILSQFISPQVVNFFAQNLDSLDDLSAVIRNRKSNLSKAMQLDMNAFYKSLLASNVWRNGKPAGITGRSVSLQCLDFVVRHLREAGSTADILSQSLVERLINILVVGQDASFSGEDQYLMTDIRAALSILESFTITRSTSPDRNNFPWKSEQVDKLKNFLAMILVCSAASIGITRTLALRLCLNLTNNSPALCKAFSTFEVIDANVSLIKLSFKDLSAGVDGTSQALLLDNLVLSLGLLINLAEWSESTRELFTATRDNTPPALDTLSSVFRANLQRTSEVCA